MNDRGDRELRKGHSAEEAFKIYFFPYFRVSGSGFLYLFPFPVLFFSSAAFFSFPTISENWSRVAVARKKGGLRSDGRQKDKRRESEAGTA